MSLRIACWILAAFIVAVIVLPYVCSDQARGWLGSGVGVRVVLAEFVFVLPAMVIAWSHQYAPADLVRQAKAGIWLRRTTAAIVGVAVAIPLISSLALPFVPISTERSVTRLLATTSPRYSLRAPETVGWFMRAKFPINSTVGWNGRRAFAVDGITPSE